MLKSCTVLCLLLCCDIATFDEFDQGLVAEPTHETNQHPRYLKEFFPFLTKTDLSEDMKSLLTSLKRKKRVCHHGNKRGSHIVHFKPARDVRIMHYPSRSVNFSSVTKRAEKYERNRRQVVLGRYEDKAEEPRSTAAARAKKDVTEISKVTDTIEPSATTLEQTNVKRSDEVEMVMTNPPLASTADITTKSSTMLFTMTEFVPTASPNQHPSVQIIGLIKPSLVPLVIQTQTPLSPTEVVRLTEHSPRQKFVLDLNTNSFKPADNNLDSLTLAKRGNEKRDVETKPRKSIKSVITKILIIPVERQVEEFNDETAEEVDVVSLKHTRDNKKKTSGKHKSTSNSPTTAASVATDNFTHTSATEDSSSSKTELSTAESTAKEVVTSPKPTSKPTSRGSTKLSKTTKKKQAKATARAISSTDATSMLTTVLGTKETEPVSTPAPNVTSVATSVASEATT